MNKLTKDKQNQLVLTCMVILMALSGLWFGVIKFQKRSLLTIQDLRAAAEQNLKRVEAAVKNAPQVETQLAETGGKLSQLETGMASGDLYSWVIETIRQFKLSYRVDIPQFSQIDGPKDVSMIPGFPYKQATLAVGGTAFYYDLGRFIADFENQFPYARICNLTLEPVPGAGANDAEKLSFRMDILVLVKPSAS